MYEILKPNFDDMIWKSATSVVTIHIEAGKMSEAKKQARKSIDNWREENKTEMIDKFKMWLKDNNIELDKE